MTVEEFIPTIETLTWQDVRQDVKRVNPEFAKLVDEIDPDDSYLLYRVKYPYGAMVFTEGVVNLPNDSHEFVPLDHHSLSSKLRDQLSYRTIPMGMVLKKSLEVHAETEDRLIPLTVMLEGTPFGVWETFDPMYSYFIKLSWNLSSGARSIFMLPKISESVRYQRLTKEYDIRANRPRKIKDHWKVFKDIVNSKNFPEQWNSEVLFFSRKWFEMLNKKDQWLGLQNFLLRAIWQQSLFWRAQVTVNLIWQQFAEIIKRDNIRCGSYHLETLKHLVILGVGALPVFSCEDESSYIAPIDTLQKVFIQSYGIDYVPTIMYPRHLPISDKGAMGYYSINEPTLIESVPKTREVLNILQVTKEIKFLFDSFKMEVISGKLKIENTPIYELIKKASFEFCHTAPDPANELILSGKLPLKDPSLLSMPKGFLQKDFCCTSNFLRGCVKITL